MISNASDPEVVVVRARAEHGDALGTFFERADAACHCRYWHFEGDTNAWLARVAHEPTTNRREMNEELRSDSSDALGFVALAGGEVFGWTKIARARVLAKLYAQRPYRGLSCLQGDRTGVYAIACTLVLPTYRRRGLARALVRAAIDGARAEGARAVEVFPRRGEPLRDDELATGPYSLFVAEGFTVVNDFAPYPVLRRIL